MEACVLTAPALQREKPLQREACTLQPQRDPPLAATAEGQMQQQRPSTAINKINEINTSLQKMHLILLT